VDTELITGAAAERQLRSFIAKFSPADQKLIRAVRAAVRRRLPTAHELAYDNYNFAAVAHSKVPFPTRGRGRLVIRAVSAKQRPRQRTLAGGSKVSGRKRRPVTAGRTSRSSAR